LTQKFDIAEQMINNKKQLKNSSSIRMFAQAQLSLGTEYKHLHRWN